MIEKIKIGDVVEVRFLDHAEHGADMQEQAQALDFTVFGRVVATNKKSITIETWCYTNPREPRDSNVSCFTIIRGAITSLVVLKAGTAGHQKPPQCRPGCDNPPRLPCSATRTTDHPTVG